MPIFIFLKTIADMFYSFPMIDYVLMAVASVFFINSFKNKIQFHIEDYFVFVFMGLLCLTMIRTGTGFNHFVKMISGFMLYFIGRGYKKNVFKVEKKLVNANYIVLIINTIIFLIGLGFTTWGNAITFRGLYFYKTDFSIAMIYALSAFMFFENPVKIISIIEWLVIAYLILRSNTRAALLILFLVLGLWLIYLYEKKTGKTMKINIIRILSTALGMVIGIFVIVKILSLPALAEYHFISFKFDKLSDLYDSGNTQGRNVIWEAILTKYRNASFIQKVIGIDFVSDRWSVFESHNAYIKILFSTGCLGLIVFIGFIIIYILRLNKLKNRSLFYYNTSILMTFMIQSISQSSIDFTQMTWTFFLFAGFAVSESYRNEGQNNYYNLSQKSKVCTIGKIHIRIPSLHTKMKYSL